MKTIIAVFSIILMSQFSYGHNCIGEAQIIAKVKSIKKKTATECVVDIDPLGVQYYNMSVICPLDIDEVLQRGISVGFIEGNECYISTDGKISGVAVLKHNVTIILDR